RATVAETHAGHPPRAQSPRFPAEPRRGTTASTSNIIFENRFQYQIWLWRQGCYHRTTGMDTAQTLLLNQGFEPIKVISWQRAITLLFLGKVEVLEEYDHNIRSVTMV